MQSQEVLYLSDIAIAAALQFFEAKLFSMLPQSSIVLNAFSQAYQINMVLLNLAIAFPIFILFKCFRLSNI